MKLVRKTLTEVIIPEGVTAIIDSSFYMQSKLSKITLPEGVKTIGAHSFRGCDIKSWNFPSALEVIGSNAFAINYTMGYHQEVVFPDTVKTIDASAFAHTHIKQEELIFPASVETIGSLAFTGALKGTHKRLVFKGTPTSIANNAFQSAVTTDVYCPWVEGAVAGAPWGATNATIHYLYPGGDYEEMQVTGLDFISYTEVAEGIYTIANSYWNLNENAWVITLDNFPVIVYVHNLEDDNRWYIKGNKMYIKPTKHVTEGGEVTWHGDMAIVYDVMGAEE